MSARKRYDHARELRSFAKRLRDSRFRGTEGYLEDMDGIARDMDARADDLVRTDEPCLEGVFQTGPGTAGWGKRLGFRAEKKAA